MQRRQSDAERREKKGTQRCKSHGGADRYDKTAASVYVCCNFNGMCRESDGDIHHDLRRVWCPSGFRTLSGHDAFTYFYFDCGVCSAEGNPALCGAGKQPLYCV